MPKSKSFTAPAAIRAIESRGLLLVFPLDNRKEPASLWSEFVPRSPMRWEWDESGDNRVADLWHLRTQLSTTGRVVYTKWYRGRATFFSREVFTAMLRLLGAPQGPPRGLSRQAREILEVLRMDSPLSTKQLKRATDLVGRANESAYTRALGELWARLLIVAYGEVEDGAFPSIAVGATQLLFEDLWERARELSDAEALETLRLVPGEASPWFKHYLKVAAGIRAKQDIDRLAY